jgi:hypothetical protein
LILTQQSSPWLSTKIREYSLAIPLSLVIVGSNLLDATVAEVLNDPFHFQKMQLGG